MPMHRAVVIGAGIGGLAAAVELAARGVAVRVVERSHAPGGKMREVTAGGLAIDSGPTVFTMRGVFDELFEAAGGSLDAALRLHRAGRLARHAWSDTERLDLHADLPQSVAAIGAFAGRAEAARFEAFAAEARRIHHTLERSYLRAPRPNPLSLAWRIGLHRPRALLGIRPFATLWDRLGHHFHDPRLRQLFGRYATYCGSSPFLAPATLMLVAHVEQDGVWLVEGGMQRLAEALAALAARHGAVFDYGASVQELQLRSGRAAGVRLDDGRCLDADAVVMNGDVAALGAGGLGVAARCAAAPVAPAQRSLSAITWSMAARTAGFPLLRHNVFFSNDYAAEFDDVFVRRRPPREPTVYVCAQDRDDREDAPAPSAERLLCLINAPATGDDPSAPAEEHRTCGERTFRALERCGLTLQPVAPPVLTTPREFAALFPATGGALYGRATHGWRASFQRPGSRSALPGLYLAGGSTHPGAGVPMAALSGRLAAASVIEDLVSTARSAREPTPGGTSTR